MNIIYGKHKICNVKTYPVFKIEERVSLTKF